MTAKRAERPKVKLVDGICALCKRALMVGAKWDAAQREWIVDRERVTCSLICRAQLLWSTEQWEGQARMAQVRVDCGIELNDLDRLALARQHA